MLISPILGIEMRRKSRELLCCESNLAYELG